MSHYIAHYITPNPSLHCLTPFYSSSNCFVLTHSMVFLFTELSSSLFLLGIIISGEDVPFRLEVKNFHRANTSCVGYRDFLCVYFYFISSHFYFISSFYFVSYHRRSFKMTHQNGFLSNPNDPLSCGRTNATTMTGTRSGPGSGSGQGQGVGGSGTFRFRQIEHPLDVDFCELNLTLKSNGKIE